ncbi:MAG: hypothetical protein ACPG21_05235 [Crocinitomicaceae bacterium]
MKKILMIAAVALLAVACNKNQRVVKKLDGTWTATEFKVSEDGVTVDWLAEGFINSLTMTFDACKLKDDEFCNVTTAINTDFGDDTEADVYRVTNDGTTLETKDDLSATTIHSMEIVDMTGSYLELKEVDGDTETVVKLEK